MADMKMELAEIFSRHKRAENELIPILQETQEELGYLPEGAMSEISKFLGIAESVTFGVATFYAQFKFAPTGRKIVKVCRGTACHVRGGARILSEIERRLGIKPGETTKDLEYSLETIACFGSCALAPVVVVSDNVYGRMTPSKVAEILGNKEKKSEVDS